MDLLKQSTMPVYIGGFVAGMFWIRDLTTSSGLITKFASALATVVPTNIVESPVNGNVSGAA